MPKVSDGRCLEVGVGDSKLLPCSFSWFPYWTNEHTQFQANLELNQLYFSFFASIPHHSLSQITSSAGSCFD